MTQTTEKARAWGRADAKGCSMHKQSNWHVKAYKAYKKGFVWAETRPALWDEGYIFVYKRGAVNYYWSWVLP